MLRRLHGNPLTFDPLAIALFKQADDCFNLRGKMIVRAVMYIEQARELT
jgi:hypothetical protein